VKFVGILDFGFWIYDWGRCRGEATRRDLVLHPDLQAELPRPYHRWLYLSFDIAQTLGRRGEAIYEFRFAIDIRWSLTRDTLLAATYDYFFNSWPQIIIIYAP